MRIFSSKRRAVVTAALVLLVLFIVRPGASRLKSRVIRSLSAAVARPVDIGSVQIRLLPRPAFDIENLVVYDDPAFSSEPMLRSRQVTAELRLMSLVRGRLEVARLDLTEPSLNLVHHVGGGWNLESLLEHTAHRPLAPTGKARSEPRPGFPYIEGTSGRINFKNGPEKKPYALTNADFALWQESENAWGARLKAEPFRSDMNLNDIGLLQVSGIWQRAETFRDTPVQFSIEWSRAQLGQVTKFFTGNDQGWRGAILLDATVTGSPAALKIAGTVSADDFRRYDITSGTSLRLSASCSGEYSTYHREFRGIECRAPIGDGLLTITGDAGIPGSHQYAVSISAEEVPASALGALAQRIKKNLPEDLAVDGLLRANLAANENASSGQGPRLEGRGEIRDFLMSSALLKAELGPETIPFEIASSGVKSPRPDKGTARLRREPRLELGPFALEKGRPGGATVHGWVDHSGYAFTLSGDVEVGRSLRLARMLGIPALNATLEGVAQTNIQTLGSWPGQSGMQSFAGPQVTGSARLRNIRFGLRGAGEPVEISSAEMQLLPNEVRVGRLNAKAAGSTWKGSMEMPRGCETPEKCPMHFALNADEIDLHEATAWASSSLKNRPWYQVLGGPQNAPSLLARVHAFGRVRADHFVLQNLTASMVSADISIDSGKLAISSIEADMLGGKHRGQWLANFDIKPPLCAGDGNLAGISLANVARLMKDDWIVGTAGMSYKIKGPCTADFWQSSEGTMQVGIADGILTHMVLGDSGERLKVSRFGGRLQWGAGKFEVSDAELDSPDGRYEVSGTATFQRQIDLKIVRLPASAGSASYAVTGTLAQPRVAAISRTEQARVKAPTE